MKIAVPSDHPFAVNIPALDLEDVAPGVEVDCSALTADEVRSFLAQGWTPVDTDAKKLAKISSVTKTASDLPADPPVRSLNTIAGDAGESEEDA